MTILRSYQQNAVDKGLEVLLSPKPNKSVIVIPTGGGKTHCITAIVNGLDGNVIIVSPNKEILTQSYNKFIDAGGEACIFSASMKRKETDCKVIYATSASLKSQHFLNKKIKYIIIDECFPKNTPVLTSTGLKYINKIVEEVNNGEDVFVKSYNQEGRYFEYKKVLKGICNGEKELIKMDFYKNSFECTPDHKILTLSGWKEATNIQIGEGVITSCDYNSNSAYCVLNKDQEDLVIGNILGDGFLEKRGEKTFRIGMIQGDKQKEYLTWKTSILSCPEKIRCVEKNGYSQKKAWRLYTPVFYTQNNILDYDLQISKLNAKSLAVLWMDDGHMAKLENAGSLYSLCDDECRVNSLNIKIKQLGITGTIVSKTKSSSTGRDVWYIRFLKQSIEDISKICSKYIHPSMSYKINSNHRHLVGTYNWDTKFESVVKTLRKKTKSVSKKVYDIEVQDNHNFIVSSVSAYKATNYNLKAKFPCDIEGIVVHNCHINTQTNSMLTKFIKELKISNLLGFTASPVYLKASMGGSQLKMMNRVKGKLFNDISYVTQISELVSSKHWSPIIYDVKEVKSESLQYNSNGSEFTKESLISNYENNDMDSRIIKCINDNPDRKSVLIFVPTVSEAKELQKKIKGSEAVYSGMDDKYRDYVIEGFKRLEIRIVINVNILSFGFDHPLLDHVIGASPSASIALVYQQWGRGVRPHIDKLNCLISDLAGNVDRFGKLENLSFQNIEGYGWGMFNGDVLLTGVPFWESEVTTIPDLINRNKQKKENTLQEIKSGTVTGDISLKFWFGKFNGLSCEHVVKKDAQYVSWMLTKADFDWSSKKMSELKGVLLHFMRKYYNKHL